MLTPQKDLIPVSLEVKHAVLDERLGFNGEGVYKISFQFFLVQLDYTRTWNNNIELAKNINI